MIVLQFSAQDNLPSELIEWYGHGCWSHVDAVLPDGRLLGSRSDVRAGVPSGVEIRPAGYAPFSRVLHVAIDAPPDVGAAFDAFLHAQIGKPYDHSAILGFLTDRDWRDPRSFFCSELQASALETAGWFRWPLAAPANKITPDDLLLAISATECVAA